MADFDGRVSDKTWQNLASLSFIATKLNDVNIHPPALIYLFLPSNCVSQHESYNIGYKEKSR